MKATGMFTGNFLIDNFRKGGPIMWPILIVSIVGLTVVIERICWWTARWMRRDPKRIEKVFTAIETGDVAEASKLSRASRDPVLRMMWNGLNHQHAVRALHAGPFQFVLEGRIFVRSQIEP